MKLVAAVVMLAACSMDKPAPECKPAPAPPPPRIAVRMERTPCYGTCPVYTVDVAPDGTVTFEGKDHVATKARALGRISAERVAALGQAVEAAQLFALRDRYVDGDECTSMYTDAASVTITATIAGRTKTVEHYHGCEGAPAQLDALEEAIDLLAGAAAWVGPTR